MTVEELIEALKKLNPQKLVTAEYGGESSSVYAVTDSEYDHAVIIKCL